MSGTKVSIKYGFGKPQTGSLKKAELAIDLKDLSLWTAESDGSEPVRVGHDTTDIETDIDKINIDIQVNADAIIELEKEIQLNADAIVELSKDVELNAGAIIELEKEIQVNADAIFELSKDVELNAGAIDQLDKDAVKKNVASLQEMIGNLKALGFIGDGSGLTGITANQLDDVDTSAAKRDDFLIYNGAGQWVAEDFHIDTELTYQGGIALSSPAPVGPANGDLYINNTDGVVHPSWTGIEGQTVKAGNVVGWAATKSRWFLLGDIASSSVTDVEGGLGISVDDSKPAEPIVSIDRDEVDTWYLGVDDQIWTVVSGTATYDGSIAFEKSYADDYKSKSGSVGFQMLYGQDGQALIPLGSRFHSHGAVDLGLERSVNQEIAADIGRDDKYYFRNGWFTGKIIASNHNVPAGSAGGFGIESASRMEAWDTSQKKLAFYAGPTLVATFNTDGSALFTGSVTATGFIGDGSKLTGISSASHNHDGVYQPAGSYATANHNHSGVYQPVGDYALKSYSYSKSESDAKYALKGSSGTTPTLDAVAKAGNTTTKLLNSQAFYALDGTTSEHAFYSENTFANSVNGTTGRSLKMDFLSGTERFYFQDWAATLKISGSYTGPEMHSGVHACCTWNSSSLVANPKGNVKSLTKLSTGSVRGTYNVDVNVFVGGPVVPTCSTNSGETNAYGFCGASGDSGSSKTFSAMRRSSTSAAIEGSGNLTAGMSIDENSRLRTTAETDYEYEKMKALEIDKMMSRAESTEWYDADEEGHANSPLTWALPNLIRGGVLITRSLVADQDSKEFYPDHTLIKYADWPEEESLYDSWELEGKRLVVNFDKARQQVLETLRHQARFYLPRATCLQGLFDQGEELEELKDLILGFKSRAESKAITLAELNEVMRKIRQEGEEDYAFSKF